MSRVLAFSVLSALLAIGTAQAAEVMTFVSSAGSDAADCTRPSPCRTFKGALAKTAEGGTIVALNAANYEPVTITKAISIDGQGVALIGPGGGLSPNIGIRIVADATDDVAIRGVSIEGVTKFATGIEIESARHVHLLDMKIEGVYGTGVYVESGATKSIVHLQNSTIIQAKTGIVVTATTAKRRIFTENVTVTGGTVNAALVDGGSAALIAINSRFLSAPITLQAGGLLTSYGDNVFADGEATASVNYE